MYKDGDQLPYKQIMDNCNIKKCWDTLLGSSDYNARKKEIAEFNQYATYSFPLVREKSGVKHGQGNTGKFKLNHFSFQTK